ncbi:MAG: hypothetical protein RIR52_2742 [Acidobacteriota bacterium]
MRGLIRFLAVVVMTTSGVSGQSPVVPPRSDNQFWNETQLVKPLSERRDLVLIGGLRIGRGWGRPVDERLGAGVAFKLNRHLTIQPTYLFVAYQPFPGREFTEHRLVFNLTGRVKLKNFNIADRNLIERRVRPTGADFTTYRNRLMVDHPVRLGSVKFNPFIANELWYTTQPVATGRFGWSRNRFSVGILKQFTPKFYAEIHYLHQNDGLSRPGNIHTVMTFFRYTL